MGKRMRGRCFAYCWLFTNYTPLLMVSGGRGPGQRTLADQSHVTSSTTYGVPTVCKAINWVGYSHEFWSFSNPPWQGLSLFYKRGYRLKEALKIVQIPRVKQIAGEKLLYSTGSSGWYSLMTQRGRGRRAAGRELQEGGHICIHIAGSCCCTAETNTTFESNFIPIK